MSRHECGTGSHYSGRETLGSLHHDGQERPRFGGDLDDCQDEERGGNKYAFFRVAFPYVLRRGQPGDQEEGDEEDRESFYTRETEHTRRRECRRVIDEAAGGFELDQRERKEQKQEEREVFGEGESPEPDREK